MSGTYALHGFNPSPYSVKMRALMRYRRLPFVWNATGNPREAAIAAGLPPVIPVLRFPDGRVMNDSTPLAHALERAHPGQRSIIPDDPAQLRDAFQKADREADAGADVQLMPVHHKHRLRGLQDLVGHQPRMGKNKPHQQRLLLARRASAGRLVLAGHGHDQLVAVRPGQGALGGAVASGAAAGIISLQTRSI